MHDCGDLRVHQISIYSLHLEPVCASLEILVLQTFLKSDSPVVLMSYQPVPIRHCSRTCLVADPVELEGDDVNIGSERQSLRRIVPTVSHDGINENRRR